MIDALSKTFVVNFFVYAIRYCCLMVVFIEFFIKLL
jgi:hypothetical protein